MATQTSSSGNEARMMPAWVSKLSSLFIGPESAGEPRKATSSIPAHFRLAAIGVVIAHPKVGPLRSGLNSENPVSTHTTMAVAKPCNAGSIQGKLAVPIVEHDEVVARAVHLGEGKLHSGES